MVDTRFDTPGVDARFPDPATDTRFALFPYDDRFPDPGTDTRFEGVRVPVISIQSGSGYAGSVYAADLSGGQWYADGVALAGQTGQTWTMTVAYEGAAITYRRSGKTSNVIEMWVYTDLGSLLRGWWDAMSASTIQLNGSGVASWQSRSSALTVSQATASLQPAYSETARNGLPGVIADGIDDNLALGSVSASDFPNGASPSVLACVGYLSAAGSYPQILSVSPVSPTARTQRCIFSSTATRAVGISLSSADFSTGVSWTADRVVVAEFLAVRSLRETVDGTPYSFTPAGDMITNSVQFVMFRNNTPGVLQEALAIAGTLTTDQRQMVEGMAAWRWSLQANLPAGHPYKSAAPRVQ